MMIDQQMHREYAVRVGRVEVPPEAWEAWPSRLPSWETEGAR